MSFITISDVRRVSGVPVTLMTDAQITSMIPIIEGLVEKWLNTKFTPTEVIEIQDGNGLPRFCTMYNPLLAVRYLSSDSTSLVVSTLNVYRSSGMVRLGTNSQMGSFVAKQQSIIVKYVYGLVEETTTKTTITSASIAGSSITLNVSSSTGFAANDWIDVYGVDGYREAAKVTATGTGTITVDQLMFTHINGSSIVLLDISEPVQRYIELEAAIYAGITAIGGSYDFQKSYTLGDFTTSKDAAAEHWKTTLSANIAERDFLKKTIQIRPAIIV
jgi:uncharacterized protein YqfB (UPF0267 family)